MIVTNKVKGSFSIRVEESGETVLQTGEIDNLVTDAALADPCPFVRLDYGGIAGNQAIQLCLGAGVVTAPAYGDTNLGNQIASELVNGANGAGYSSNFNRETGEGVYPAVFKQSKEMEFTGLSGDLSEVGIKKGGTLMTRSLIKDESGNPITIPVTSNQTVRVTYTIYSIIPSEVLGTGTLSTPYGDVGYTVFAPTSNNISNGIFALQFSSPTRHSQSGYDDRRRFALFSSGGFVKNSDNLSTGGPDSIDLSGRTVTMRPYFGYEENSYAFDEMMVSRASNGASEGISVVFDTPMTIPANYDFAFKIQFGWERN
tara:strand:+ start:1048 stop:1989 length:942 start_codon:yes stop_codon:yes gene_type:complete